MRSPLIAALLLAGCGQPLYGTNQNGMLTSQGSVLGLGRDEDLARASAGQTGCEPSQIHIYNRDQPLFGGSTSWGADCEGRSYLCSTGGGGTSCAERGGRARTTAAAAPAPAPPPRGVRRI